eukprot:CAMPEP_0170114312 /NCGR_PEP_ID=MMETSP0020_2-20130122/10602_1 /TAXON_ID=98059 /ORGANISM="Dinobryon sp., Strain UTEXLB2267" /LENGTH=70 /DNA_ID=CAMNT_0010341221 /DNA_START=1193 /DNA_END=1405 /DNA_ORIENTATION=-
MRLSDCSQISFKQQHRNASGGDVDIAHDEQDDVVGAVVGLVVQLQVLLGLRLDEVLLSDGEATGDAVFAV